VESFDLPHPCQLLFLVVRLLSLKTRRNEVGDGRERERERGETSDGNAILRE
jgi:hypothetical protein